MESIAPQGEFTKKLWEGIAPLYQQLIVHPFVKGLANGTLPHTCFSHYLSQDILYIKDDNQALKQLGIRAKKPHQSQFFEQMAEEGLGIERALQADYLVHFNVEPATSQSEAVAAYTHFLLHAAFHAPFCVGTAALLPCFWVYSMVGKSIQNQSGHQNPYKKWIETYGGSNFEGYVIRFIQIVEEQATLATPELRDAMCHAFSEATKHELSFFSEAMAKQN